MKNMKLIYEELKDSNEWVEKNKTVHSIEKLCEYLVKYMLKYGCVLQVFCWGKLC